MIMPFCLNLYHDQVDASGTTTSALPKQHRVLYIRHGSVKINGRLMNTDDAFYCDEAIELQSSGAWCQIWRWDLSAPDAPPLLQTGNGVFSSLRMSRVISTLALLEQTRWLFRLDRIITAAGRIADRHQHPGPGIRCLREGTFNVQQDGESARNLGPGDAWFETGSDTVIAWSSRQISANFMRGMVLPVEWEGKVTGTWLSGAPTAGPPRNWKLYVDQVITV
jgi:hypothetical protein